MAAAKTLIRETALLVFLLLIASAAAFLGAGFWGELLFEFIAWAVADRKLAHPPEVFLAFGTVGTLALWVYLSLPWRK